MREGCKWLVRDVRIVRAEGLAMGEAPKAAALSAARADMELTMA